VAIAPPPHSRIEELWIEKEQFEKSPLRLGAGSIPQLPNFLIPSIASVGSDRLVQGHARVLDRRRPGLSAVTGHVHGQFQAAPNAQFVEGAAQVVFDDLLAGADDAADLAVGQAVAGQPADLALLGSQLR